VPPGHSVGTPSATHTVIDDDNVPNITINNVTVDEDDGIAVLFTEHDMDVVFAHADRVLVLVQGELIAAGKPDEVRADARVQRAYLGVDHD